MTRRNQPARKLPNPIRKLSNIAIALLKDRITHDTLEALHELDERLAAIGYPTGGSSGRTAPNTDPAGDAALVATETLAHRQHIVREIEELHDRVHNLHRFCRWIIAAPEPKATDHKLCCDGQVGREGATEWAGGVAGGHACHTVPDARGLCRAHYDAERYWRRQHGLPGREHPGQQAA